MFAALLCAPALQMRQNEIRPFNRWHHDLPPQITGLLAVAGSPELYPTLVEAGAVATLVNLLTHENPCALCAVWNSCTVCNVPCIVYVRLECRFQNCGEAMRAVFCAGRSPIFKTGFSNNDTCIAVVC